MTILSDRQVRVLRIRLHDQLYRENDHAVRSESIQCHQCFRQSPTNQARSTYARGKPVETRRHITGRAKAINEPGMEAQEWNRSESKITATSLPPAEAPARPLSLLSPTGTVTVSCLVSLFYQIFLLLSVNRMERWLFSFFLYY
jgi:hypothetical protein